MQEQVKERKSRAALIGALAALSVFCCGLFTGVPAAVLAWDDLKAMDTGRLPTKNRTLVQIAMWFAIAGSVLWGLVFFVGVVTQAFEEVLKKSRTTVELDRNPTKSQEAEPANESPPTKDEVLKEMVRTALQDKSGKNDIVRKVEIAEKPDGGWSVSVELNVDDRVFRPREIRTWIESRMSETYVALFTSGEPIKNASVAAYHPLMGQHDRATDFPIYKTFITDEAAAKIEWSADPSVLRTDILPQAWTTSILNRSLR